MIYPTLIKSPGIVPLLVFLKHQIGEVAGAHVLCSFVFETKHLKSYCLGGRYNGHQPCKSSVQGMTKRSIVIKMWKLQYCRNVLTSDSYKSLHLYREKLVEVTLEAYHIR